MALNSSTDEQAEIFNRFAPVRLVNGFIAVDFVWGCYKCGFCFNRNRFHLYPSSPLPFSMTPGDAAGWIVSTPSFQTGTVVKVGHNSDQSLMEDASWEFYRKMPKTAPMAFYRRKPLSKDEFTRFQEAGDNLLLVLTLTPGSRILGVEKETAWKALESAKRLKNCFFAIRPVAGDAVEEAQRLTNALPEKSIADLCGVISTTGGESVSFDDEISPDPGTMKALRTGALERGIRVNCAVNCILKGKNKEVSHWADKNFLSHDPDVLAFCRACPSFRKCETGMDSHRLSELLEQAGKQTGLTDLSVSGATKRRLDVHTSFQMNRGDQTFLRGLFGARIEKADREKLLDKVTPEIYARWKKTRFFPVDEITEVAKAMQAELRGKKILS